MHCRFENQAIAKQRLTTPLGFPYISNINGQVDDNQISALNGMTWAVPDDYFEALKTADSQARQYKKALEDTNKKLAEFLEDELNNLKSKAENSAKEQYSDDGTYFVFDQKQQYFTSEKQTNIAENMRKIMDNRPSKEADFFKLDNDTAKARLQKIWYSSMYLNMELIHFTRPLRRLNNDGYVVKEQCLTLAELEGTVQGQFKPDGVKDDEWREVSIFDDNDKNYNTIKNIFKALGINALSPENKATKKPVS